MIKSLILLVFTALYLMVSHSDIQAQEQNFLPANQAMCDQLLDEAAYKEKRLTNYQYILAGKDGWVFRSNVSFQKNFLINHTTLNNIKMLQEGFHQYGTELVIILPPSRFIVHFDKITDQDKSRFNFSDNDHKNLWVSYHKTIQALKENDVHVVGINNLPKDGNFYYKRDHHWSPYGARVTAEKTAQYIKSLPIYPKLTKYEFVTTKQSEVAYKGTFNKAFEEICSTSLIPETIAQFSTQPIDVASNNSQIFDVEKNEVVLLGTSNSANDPNVSNFDGFLKQALGVNIQNHALAGAGIDTSIISYLNSDGFRNNPPKLVLWEIPGYYNVNRMNSLVFLQATPATYGQCDDNPIVEIKDYVIKDNNEKLLSDLETKDIKGLDYYITLDFKTPVEKRFTVKMIYDQYTDTHAFKRSKRYPESDGIFFRQLRFDNKGALKTLSISTSDDMIGRSVTARICKIPE